MLIVAPRYAHAQAAATSRVRSHDAVGVFDRGDLCVVAMADGGGGMHAGDAASRSVLAVVASAVADPLFAAEDVRPWVDLFLEVDTRLAANHAGQTTGIVIVLGRNGLLGLSVGNSEAWVVTSTGVDNLTVGQHTRQRLGSRRATLAVFERPSLNGLLLVATDGLFSYASAPVIAGIARHATMAEGPERLLDLVRLRSGKVADDAAVVLVQRADSPERPS